jgi:hypothetical protein
LNRLLGVELGEVRWLTPVVPRPLIEFLVAEHFAQRLMYMRKIVLTDEKLDSVGRDQLLGEIDRYLTLWPRRPLLSAFYQYGLPVVTTVATLIWSAYQNVTSFSDPELRYAFLGLAAAYSAILLMPFSGASIAARGVLLGGEGDSVYAPFLLAGQGVYGLEGEALGAWRSRPREAPIDLALFWAFWILIAAAFTEILGSYPLGSWATPVQLLVGVVVVAFPTLAFVRALRMRRRLGRL